MIPKTVRTNVRMLLLAGMFTCLMTAFAGCSRLQPYHFAWDFSKQEQITQAFIESVQEYYSGEVDGHLSDPRTFPPGRSGVTVIKFGHSYTKKIPGKDHEIIKLMFWDTRSEPELAEKNDIKPFFSIEAFDYAYDNIEDAYMPGLIETIVGKMKARHVAVKRQ